MFTTFLHNFQVVEELVSNLGVIEKLTFFEHKDANGKDWGLNVRQRAKDIVALVNDPERMRAERQKVKGPTYLLHNCRTCFRPARNQRMDFKATK